MKQWFIFLVMLMIVAYSNAQIVTNCGGNPGTSTDGSHKWDVYSIKVYEDKVYVQFEVTAMKPIRRLSVYSNDSRLVFGREDKMEGIGLKGLVSNGEFKHVGANSYWGWDQIERGKKVYYTLCFGGGGSYGNTIPAGVTTISIYGIGIDIDSERTLWKSTNITINNPRKNYTSFSSEYSIKQHLDANNDGICGIYEVMGDNAGSKFACVKYNGEYALIFMSDNLGRSWWKIGDIKATLRQSASGILKADWYMSDKSLYKKDCYVGFDGVSMTVLYPSESDEKERERKYLKMYPTTSPSYNNYQQEYTPQRQQQTPQRRQTPQTKQIPVLKKQNVKK